MTTQLAVSTLDKLAADINRLDKEASTNEAIALQAYSSSIQIRWEQGQKLLEAKAALGYGEWLPWLGRNCSVGSRQAQKYMRLAQKYPDGIANSEFAFESIDKALEAIAEPSPPKQSKYDELPSLKEVHQLYGQVGTVLLTGNGKTPYAFAVENDAVGSPFPLRFNGIRSAWEYWQQKGERLLEVAKRHQVVSESTVIETPPESITTLSDGSIWEEEETANDEAIPTVRPKHFEVGDRVIVRNNIYGKAGQIAAVEQVQEHGWFVTSEGTYHGKYLELVEEVEEEVEPIQQTHPAGILASAKTNQHGTPQFIWQAGLDAFEIEEFDLDPASWEGSLIPCKKIYTKEQNGLEQDWEAEFFWANFPFSDDDGRPMMPHWVDKFLHHWGEDHIGNALILTKCDCRPEWFRKLYEACTAYCMIWGSFAFEGNENSSFFGAVVFYFGSDPERIYRAYSAIGGVSQPIEPGMFGE